MVFRRRPQHFRSLELVFDSTKHVVGAIAGHALLLLVAPTISAVTGWATPCVWYLAISGVDSTLGLLLQMWVVLGPLARLGRRYPKLTTGEYWDPRTSLKSPERFRLQLALWVGLALALRLATSGATLVLAVPVALVSWGWRWAVALGRPTKLLLVAVVAPAVGRAMQFSAVDPLIDGIDGKSEPDEEAMLWRPLCPYED